MRRALRALSTVLIVAGTLLLVDAGLTLAWQEPVSAIYARITQNRLAGELRDLEQAEPTPVERRALAHLGDEPRRMAFLARRLKARATRATRSGASSCRRSAPTTSSCRARARATFARGRATIPTRRSRASTARSPSPGTAPRTWRRFAVSTTSIAATGSSWRCPTAASPTRSSDTKIVEPTDFSVIKRVGYDRLVLTACHPLYSASKRIVAFARLVSSRAAGRGEGLLRRHFTKTAAQESSL